MHINKVTISGADDLVSHKDLAYLQAKYPFVEWGILVSTKRMGSSRYPSAQWIEQLPTGLNISMHLCGDIVREFIKEPSIEVLDRIISFWKRTQLNYSFKEYPPYPPEFINIIMTAKSTGRPIILAYNHGSKKTLDDVIENIEMFNAAFINVLYDSSGGRGTEITTLNKPFQMHYTGYAGGIGPDNIYDICDRLSAMKYPDNIWIDMESGVRTNDQLDIGKVDRVLSICEGYVNKPDF